MALDIVIIDDDDDDILILSEALQTLDPEVTIHAFTDSEHACSHHLFADKISRPDFVFIDINMPKFIGPECLSLVRANPDFDRTVVVMISTSMSEKVARELISKGADFAVPKPITLDDYKTLLLKILTRRPH